MGIEGRVDSNSIADKFAQHCNAFRCNNVDRMRELKNEYSKLRENFTGLPMPSSCSFDTELVSKVVSDLKTG